MKSMKATLFALSAFALINHPAFAGDSAYITQVGSYNNVTTSQSPGWYSSTITVNQDYGSSAETANVTQNGFGNHSATVEQNGSSDDATITQIGDSDVASIQQYYETIASTATITQDVLSSAESAHIYPESRIKRTLFAGHSQIFQEQPVSLY